MLFKLDMNDHEVLVSLAGSSTIPCHALRRNLAPCNGHVSSPILRGLACTKARTKGAHFGAHLATKARSPPT